MIVILTACRTWFAVNPFAALLLILMIADVATGVLCAIKTRTVASDVSRDGLTCKAAMLVLVGVAKALDSMFLRGLPIAETIAAGFCGSEGMSLVENAARLGVPVPQALVQVFAKLNKIGERTDG